MEGHRESGLHVEGSGSAQHSVGHPERVRASEPSGHTVS